MTDEMRPLLHSSATKIYELAYLKGNPETINGFHGQLITFYQENKKSFKN